MIIAVQILLISISIIFVVIVWQLIKHGQLTPNHSLLWLALSIVLLFLSLFRGAVKWLAGLLDVEYAPSLFFAIGIFFLTILLLNLTVIVSDLTKKDLELLHNSMLMQWRIEQLEKQIHESTTEHQPAPSEEGAPHPV